MVLELWVEWWVGNEHYRRASDTRITHISRTQANLWLRYSSIRTLAGVYVPRFPPQFRGEGWWYGGIVGWWDDGAILCQFDPVLIYLAAALPSIFCLCQRRRICTIPSSTDDETDRNRVVQDINSAIMHPIDHISIAGVYFFWPSNSSGALMNS